MRLGRLLATVFLSLGAFCPLGTHALAHAVNSPHAHDHEHDSGAHPDPGQHCSDDAPRIADSGARLSSGHLAQHPIRAVEAAVAAVAPRLLASAVLDPPLSPPLGLAAPSAAGRAPPA